MQPTDRMIQKNDGQKGQLVSQSMNKSVDQIQPISAIISQLLEKHGLLGDVDSPATPDLDDHFSFGPRWDNVLKESKQDQLGVPSS